VLPGGKVLQSYDAGEGRPGVNTDVTLERLHDGGYYEVMVHAENWLLPFGYDHKEPRPERPKRPEPRRPEPEPQRPEPEKPERPERVVLFTARQLSEISENQNLAILERYRNALVPEMQKAGITTHARVSAFLGNVVQETDHLRTLEEYGNESYFRSFLGDQWRYHGRGFLMNTWRDAYARLSRVLDVDLVSNPDLLTRPDRAAKAATWFWSQHHLNAYADRGEFKKVCAIINTGSEWGEPNGLADRLHFYDRAKRVLSKDMSGAGRIRNGYNYDGLPYINLAAVGAADETAAFALATEIRRTGIGVTVTNGARNVGPLARVIYDEPLGYRQLWILGEPALDACGAYGDLANWPISPKTDYYNLAGRDFSGTCRRAAELADEKAKETVGQKFLEEMGMANHSPSRFSFPAPAPPREKEPISGYTPRPSMFGNQMGNPPMTATPAVRSTTGTRETKSARIENPGTGGLRSRLPAPSGRIAMPPPSEA
jgi:putative chitinase